MFLHTGPVAHHPAILDPMRDLACAAIRPMPGMRMRRAAAA